jgi:hypothetical protein
MIPMNIFRFVVLALAASFLCSCRKDVTLDLPEYKQKVVIEASIETGNTALVFLSYSVPYFEEFDFSHPEKAFIKGAAVTITDGLESETLTEADPSAGFIYVGTKIRGAEGRSYTLQVTVDGRTFEASTSIHQAVHLDSLYFKGEQDSLGFLWQTFTEPAGSGAAYRWMAKRLKKDIFFAAPFGSVFDDKFIDGKTFDFAYDRGRQPVDTSRVDFERGYYKRGDTVVVKFCRIGRREYEFWNTYYMNKSSNGNPFSAPANIKSMFSDVEHAFGGFVGYATAFDTLAIPLK